MDNLKNKVMSGFVWRYAERSIAQGVQFIVSIILARLLLPGDYGLVGLVMVFITISNVFIQSGFGQALIQKYKADDTDFSSVFFFSLGFAVLLYTGIFFAAPWIAAFYKHPQLTGVMRVLSVTLIIGSVNGVQQAYVQKKMQFKRFFFATIIGTVISAFVGIWMAYQKMGVWALVGQQLTNQVIDTVILWFTVKWRPRRVFSLHRMKGLFSYGWKLLCSSLLEAVYKNIYTLIIGKFYSTDDLGYYNRGQQFPNLIIQNINSSIMSVLLPAMSSVQNDIQTVKMMVRRSIMTSTFIIFPAMAGLAAVAKPLVSILLTDKWLACVPFLQFNCFILAWYPVHTANLQAINALGRSDIFLRLEIIKKILGVLTLVITIPMGLFAMMIGSCVTAVFSVILNAHPNKTLLQYSYTEQMKDILPALAASLFMCLAALLVLLLDLNPVITLIIQVIAGAAVYIGIAFLFKFEAFRYVLHTGGQVISRMRSRSVEK